LRCCFLLSVATLLGGCAVHDSMVAHEAPQQLIGMSEVNLQACLGSPDQHSTFGSTDILTYDTTSTSSINYAIPVVGGFGFSNGGYCHATFRVDNGRVTQLLYSGEKNATLAPDAYCAPILRTCLAYLQHHPAGAPTTPAPGGTASNGTASNGNTAPPAGRSGD
jgi:hypothetical protein